MRREIPGRKENEVTLKDCFMARYGDDVHQERSTCTSLIFVGKALATLYLSNPSYHTYGFEFWTRPNTKRRTISVASVLLR